ncbi:MAG: membrane protein insertase YidC [Paludibacteraceae bacterium]|nr:membrane protein insertase YidC [Paludibacteraceae bacterium]
MDKNTVIGFLLILAIMVGFSYFTRPSEEELEKQRAAQDSIRAVHAEQEAQREIEYEEAERLALQKDSAREASMVGAYGEFGQFVSGEDKDYTIENELLKVTVSAKGGAVTSVEVKDYTNADDQPLILFDKSDSYQSITLVTATNKVVETKDLYFTATQKGDSILEMSLPFESGAITYTYRMHPNSYLVDYDIKAVGLEKYLSQRENGLDMEFDVRLRQQERGRKFENRYSGLYYKFLEDDVENLETEKDDAKKLTNKVKWIGFKDQFFSTVLISRGESNFTSVDLTSEVEPDVWTNSQKYLKSLDSKLLMTFDPSGAKATTLQYFFGPNQYKILRSFDHDAVEGEQLELDEMLPLGWAIFGWCNKYLIIPIFNWLGNYFVSYGLIIFLLTLIIKLILLPFTFKSYMSTAKMRVLRPQIEELTAKYPAGKETERSQATMELYRKAGVNPMGGCLPMLLQMPILFAMFTFFPSCIELRHQAFLWADDLSAYDSIVSWDTYIPIISSIYGNHVSLFCLLMCITNIVYSYLNMKDQPTNSQMPAMKWMMYLMPVMFLFIFNDYAAGLSYYYLVSLLITIGQTFLFRLFVNDEKVLAQLEKNKKKPQKKSGFMARLEQMQKQQQAMAREQAKKRK